MTRQGARPEHEPDKLPPKEWPLRSKLPKIFARIQLEGTNRRENHPVPSTRGDQPRVPTRPQTPDRTWKMVSRTPGYIRPLHNASHKQGSMREPPRVGQR